jgi:general L-amino acid transport system permease protein
MERRPRTLDVTVHQAVPFWRDIRIIQIAAQFIFALLTILIILVLINNILTALAAIGQRPSLDFWQEPAGFDFSEGPGVRATDTTLRAFTVGVINTLRAVGIGLVAATVLGVLVGIALLSRNWLLRNLTQAFVEIFRNTPLLVQLLFFYQGVFRALPQIQEATVLPGPVYLSNRGLVVPALVPTASFPTWLVFVLAGAVIGGVIWYARSRYQRETGHPGHQWLLGVLAILFCAVLGWLLVGQAPFSANLPQPTLFERPDGVTVIRRIEGGEMISPEYASLVVGLVLYTAVFIGEIVRAGIQAVPHGQVEASRALGLTYSQTLQLVILPQALRVIIPPLGNQYLNLAKNSSLATAIAFADVFQISKTLMSQTGQVVTLFISVMLVYLAMSLVISAAMNWVNARLKLKER